MMSPVFPTIRIPHLDQVEPPTVARVRLRQPHADPVRDVEAAVLRAIRSSRRLNDLRPAAKVAVAVGSRGVARIADLTRAVVAALDDMGHAPFIVPAMGSHGGGTAEGQTAVLAKLGVSEATTGAPVRATMNTIACGATADGIPCHFDAHAAQADAVVTIARVKSHTSFDRPIESGLVKMVAVGLGKQAGARNVHRLGPRGYTEVLPALARIALERAPLALGIAVVENSRHQLVTVEGVEPENFFAADQRLLKQAKALLARLPFEQVDALVVERIGKEISGAGMDYAITGRADIRGIPNPDRPFVHKIAVLGLTAETGGNAIGIGCADFTTLEVANGLDLQAMYMNAITSTMADKALIPLVLPDQRAVLQAVVATAWTPSDARVRLCQIRNTLDLDEVLVSPALLEDAAKLDGIEPLSEPEPYRFDADGRLLTRV